MLLEPYFISGREPLSLRLPISSIPMTFLYGEFDWMDSEAATKMCENGEVDGQVFSVTNSGHHLYIENPKECVLNILMAI
jgi:cardiolipin-specific phospholipase